MFGTTVAVWVLLLALIFAFIFIWCACVAAKQTDEDAEEWMRTNYGGKR